MSAAWCHDDPCCRDTMRKLYSWSRPEPRIYSYNTDPSTFSVGYSSSGSAARSARASSVAVASEAQSARGMRASTAAPASAVDSLEGYSGFFGRQLAQHKTASSATAATAVRSSAATAVSSSVSETVTKQTEVRSKVRAWNEGYPKVCEEGPNYGLHLVESAY